MDFSKLLDDCKFLFPWKSEGDLVDLEVVEIHRDRLIFKNTFPLPGKACPELTVSLKVKTVWHEHKFQETEWLVGESGSINGMRLIGDDSALLEWRKNLEIGLCV